MSEEKTKQSFKFPTEMVDLPSGGKCYPKESPLSSGKIELKYMTAKEEDILTSQNLIKKGVVIDVLLDSLIMTEGIKIDDLVLGDKNAVMVAARILAYGPEYKVELSHPSTGEKEVKEINLADCPFRKVATDIDLNNLEITLPVSKKVIGVRLLTGKEEKAIAEDLKASKKTGIQVSPELTTRLRYTIKSVDGDENQSVINTFANNILSRDSLHLRQEMKKMTPDIELIQEVEIGGETVEVDIPMTVGFFWPNIKA